MAAWASALAPGRIAFRAKRLALSFLPPVLCFLFVEVLRMLTKEAIYEKVSATLADSLNVDAEEIRPEATLQGDLGAESIDFLDIVFRLERGFGIKIPREELFPESIFQ